MILAVGFRVRSKRGTQFRQWANRNLREYMIKGFVMDDERLKNPNGRPDYFDELLAQQCGQPIAIPTESHTARCGLYLHCRNGKAGGEYYIPISTNAVGLMMPSKPTEKTLPNYTP